MEVERAPDQPEIGFFDAKDAQPASLATGSSATPGPVSADVPATTVSSRDGAAAVTDPGAPPRRRIHWGHPLVNLALVAGVGIGVVIVAVLEGGASVPASAVVIAPAVSSVSTPAASVSAVAAVVETPEVVAHDVDDDEQPAPKKDSSRASRKRSSSHAPDAKPGPATGFRDGKPIQMTLTMIDGKPVEVRTAASFQQMRAAARRDGVSLVVVSGFRTMERQRELYSDYRAGRGHLAALPGHSNHQSGHALDLAVAGAKVRAWLEAHAGEFGFRRAVPSEAWHWEN